MALSDSLVSYWRFDESSGDAVDAVGSNDLVNTGCTYASGKINNGVDLEAGDSDYLSITDASQTGLDFTTNLTFSAWVKIESTFGGASYTILSKWTGAGANRSYSWHVFDNDIMVLQINDGTTIDEFAFEYTPGFTTGTWYHMVVTYEEQVHTLTKYVAKGYVNGDLLDMFVGTAVGIQNGAADFVVGNRGATNYFDGMIDELGAWSRALTHVEVLQLYNLGTGLTEPFTSPLGIYTAAQAGVEFDNFTEDAASGANSGVEPFDHVCDGDILFVCHEVSDIGVTVSGITAGGQSMTNLFTYSASNSETSVWYLVSPPRGTISIDITWTGGTPPVSRSGAISFKNIDYANPLGTSYSKTDNTNTDTVEFKKIFPITAERGMTVDFFGGRRVLNGYSEDAQTEKMNNTGSWNGGAGDMILGISYQPHWGFDIGMMWLDIDANGTGGIPSQRGYYTVELNYGGFIAQNGMIM